MIAQDHVQEVAEEVVRDIYGTGDSLERMNDITEGEAGRLAGRWEERLGALLAERDKDWEGRIACAEERLTAALAREAGLRGALEGVERATFSGIPGSRCECCSARTQDIDPYDPPRVLPKPDPHEEHCPFSALQDRPPLAQAAAEVLEAAGGVARTRKALRDTGGWQRAAAETQAGLALAELEDRVDQYLALRRGEREEGS